MKRKRVLVTGVSSDAGLSVLHQLEGSGYEVIGTDRQRLPFGLHSRHLRTVHLLPQAPDRESDRSFIDLVSSVRPDAFLPLGIHSVAMACRQAAALKTITLTHIPTYDAYMAAFDKTRCNRECKELGIPCPETFSPEEAERILTAGHGDTTLVIKPGTDIGMARGVEYVQNIDALQQSVSSCKLHFGSATIQEYIPGDTSHMHTAVLLFDRQSELVASFTTQKLRQWPPTGGVTALSISTNEFLLVEQCLPFFKKWRWQGAAEIEMKFDARDNKYKVIEINPRFPGYLRFPMICGLPLARLAASLTLNDSPITPVKYPSYAVGMKFINPGIFLRTTFSNLRSPSSKAGEFRRIIADLAGTGPTVGSMLKDPLPMLGRFFLDIRHLSGLTQFPSFSPARRAP